jgi:broad specificity phosphatase PhoE
MRSIYLIRHGNNEAVYGDPVLTEKGMKQASKVKIDNLGIIYTSTSLRAEMTTKIIAENNGVVYSVTPLLKERIDMLDMPGNTYQEYRQMCYVSSNDRHYILPNGESGFSTALRYEYVIAKALNTLTGKDVAIVGHMGAFADLMKNKFTVEYLESVYPGYTNTREKAFSECSITKMNLDYNKFTIEYLGNIDHLI